jgi:hypothetical protein
MFSPQVGEMSKDDRRTLYWKHRKSKSCARRKKPKEQGFKRKKHPETFNSQLGWGAAASVIETLNKLAEYGGIEIDDDVIDKIENLVLVWGGLREAQSTSQFLSILGLYLKTHYRKSVVVAASNYIAEVFETTYDSQLGRFNISEEEKPKWLRLLLDCQQNWSLLYRNPGAEKISNVLSLCLALGLCDSANLKFEIAGMKLFSIGAAPKHKNAIALIDAVFDTIVYFAEGGYMCFKRGSIKPLLYGGVAEEEFEENYLKAMRCSDLARSGNLESVEKMSENDYDVLLSRTIEQAKTLKSCARGAMEKNLLQRKIELLQMWNTQFQQYRVQGGLRIAPYSIGIFGGTSVGKSTIANILMVTTLLHNGYAATDDRLITLNEADKFWSNYRSYMNGILLDDPGNTKAAFVERPPTQLKLQIVNNVRLYANMAEADMKGKVSVEPKVYIETKNVKDTCAHVYSNEPASITRRDHITLTCTVKPQFATFDMLDSDKVEAYYKRRGGVPLIPDLWNIKVERSYPIPDPNGGAASVGWKVLRWNGMYMEDISLATLIRFIGIHSAKYFANQKEVVENNSNLANKLVICPKCRHPTPDVCTCKKPEDKTNVYPIFDYYCPTNGYCERCECFHQEDSDDESQEDPGDDASIPSDAGCYPAADNRCVLDGYCRRCKCHHEESKQYTPEYLKEVYGEKYTKQFGKKIAKYLKYRQKKFKVWFAPFREYWLEELEDLTLTQTVKYLDWLEESEWVRWTNWVPESWMKHDYMKYVVNFTHEKEIRARVRSSIFNNIMMIIFECLLGTIFPFFFLFTLIHLVGIAGVVHFEKKRLYDELVERNDAMPEVFKVYRDKHAKWICGASLVIGALFGIALIWKNFKATADAQGNLAPTSEKDIVERDAEVNPWAGVKVSPMPCTEAAKTTKVDTLQKLVEDNLCHMELEMTTDDKKRTFECNAFFVKSNVALVPHHMWLADDVKAKFTRHDPALIGGNFSCYLYKKWSIRIPQTDLSLVWVPNGGDWKDLTQYLPLDKFAGVPARLVYKQDNGQTKVSKLYMNPEEVQTDAAAFFGAKYSLQFPTFEGLCMAPLVTETKGPLIGGFHLGGHNGTVKGCSGFLSLDALNAAYSQLERVEGVLLSKSAGTMPKKLYDKQFFESTEVHPKSPVNFLPEGTNCKYYGQCTGRATYHSDVEESIISGLVADICGVPQQWGGPKFKKGYPWQASLAYSTKPSIGVEGSLLEKAIADYKSALMIALEEIPGLKVDIRPLTEMETVCGRDGKRFIDKMPPTTSIGYPLAGSKSKYLTYLDPKDYPTHQCPAELDSRFWKVAYEMEELYLKGERAYPIFKACLKDEPTKLTKDKVRVFHGAPIALQLLIRKYFLPVARFLSMVPLISECAVGINAQGPEWDQLARHVKKFGDDRILAGDYSKYDLRMPAQVMFAAFSILIDIAVASGNYSERDVIIMRGIATDVCYPVMAYNGDLIQHYGSNPSGQNLTVYINSVVNSLLFRCSYYSICKNRRYLPEFRKVCALITYGDDAKSSVRKGFDEFNHISVAQFLEEHDMKFTMPDKESEPTPYMTDEDADLLKRKNVFNEETGLYMGALDELSIMKSLHSNLRSKAITKEQQAMQCIDGALREYVPHGETLYEQRRVELAKIATLAQIDHGCKEIHNSFAHQMDRWKEKYIQGKMD